MHSKPAHHRTRQANTSRHHRKIRFEQLEQRLVLSTFSVININDSGADSLRQAMLDANANPGTDMIEFNIPGAGPHTIQPLSALPTVTDPVVLDATTQPGYAGTPLIELDGSLAGLAVNGLHITAGNSTVRGVAINRFQIGTSSPFKGHGIWLETGGGNVIQANFIGTDTSGTIALSNEHFGLSVWNSSNNLIGTDGDGNGDAGERNVISGNVEGGLYVQSSSIGNKIAGNLIGTDATGTAALGNLKTGLFVDPSSTSNIIGTDGTGDAFDVNERNIVAGNVHHELSIYGDHSRVAGNFIGTDVTGTVAIETNDPGWTGLQVGGEFITVGTNGDGIADAVEGNLISGIYFGLELLSADHNVVAGNRIGTDVTGTVAVGNVYGMQLGAGSSFNRIGTNGDGISDGLERNIISGNAAGGIWMRNGASHDNVIAGNFIGTDVTGTAALGNGHDGIQISGHPTFGIPHSNLIGTNSDGVADAIERNVISGNGGSGIQIGNSTDNVVAGNHIGTDITGTVALVNQGNGIYLPRSTGNLIGTNGDGVNDTAEGNLISGNRSGGIYLRFSSDNVVAGNLIGTDVTGTLPLGLAGGSGASGIGIRSTTGNPPASGNRIGTNSDGVADAAEANVISGNGAMGIELFGDATTGNVIAGNFIGTDSTGTLNLGNGTLYQSKSAGVVINGGAHGNSVGGVAPNAGNVIAFNDGNGVHVVNGSTENAILGNSIYDNDERGIDLDLANTTPGDGVTPNDPGDGDTGPNNLQNFPVITSALSGGGSTTVEGQLNSTPNTTFRVEFFTSPVADPSGHGEGQTILGSADVTTNGSGVANFSVIVPTSILPGHVVTATATDPVGNTSEFSAAFATPSSVTLSIADTSVVEGDVPGDARQLVFDVTLDIPLDVDVTVEFTTQDDTAEDESGDADYESTSGVLTISTGDLSGQIIVDVTEDDKAEADETLQVVLSNALAGSYEVILSGSGVAGGGSPGVFADSGQSLGAGASVDVELGDFDGDGDQDAFVANFNGQPNRVYLNDGNGNFVDNGQLLGANDSHGVAIADLDADGDLDAFVANTNGANRIYLNDGGGNFAGSGQNLGNSYSTKAALGDLDGDGDLDAFVANHLNQTNRVYLNDGNANFTDTGQVLDNERNTDVVLADFDGDGDLDAHFTSAPNGGRPNLVFFNDGNGNFTDSGQLLGGFDTSLEAAAGDVDGDGDLDVFSANANSATSNLYLNDGSGVFVDSGQSIGVGSAHAVNFGDVDGDGDLDAFLVNGNQFHQVYLNDGNGVFTDSGQSLGMPSNAESGEGVALADLDGDGDLDAFLVNNPSSFNPPNRVFINQGTVAVTATGTIVNDDFAPVVDSGGPYTIDEGDGLSLDASATTDADSTSLTYRWDVDGDGDFDEIVTGETPTLTPAQMATLGLNDDAFITVTVEASDGTNVDTAQTMLTINNVAPDFEAGLDETLLPPVAGALSRGPISFTDPGADVWTGTVNFGDSATNFPLSINQPLKEFSIGHTYTTEGTFTVTVTVDDNDPGGTHVDTFEVTVILNEPPEIDPHSFSIDENLTAVGTVDADDPDLPADTLIFSITGNGPDDAKFAITAGGALSFIAAPDFENPTDVGGTTGDNVYLVEVEVEDSHDETATALMTVTVDPVNDNAPAFTSPATVNVPENTAAVQTISATDDDLPAQTVIFSITGNGDDDVKFEITGGNQLEFITAPDFETPLDANTDNIYEVEIEADDNNGLTTTQTLLVSVLNQASLAGVVFVDVNENSLYDANEPGIDGVLIELLDELGAPVLDDLGDPITATTSGGGFYLFEDLDPATYQVFENHPSGVDDGPELLGSLGGTVVANETMELTLNRTDAVDYVFAELGQEVTSGDTATIGFWQNKHGQALITQGGTALATWLTSNFGNVFGNTFSDGSGDDDGNEVASFFKNELFKQKGKKSAAGPAKVDAQFMGVALATYFTSSNLAGNVAASYGFNVTTTGIGTKVVNVGSHGSAFGVADDTDLTIMQLLLATNALTDHPNNLTGAARLYDTNGDGVIDAMEAALRTMANEIYSSINEEGDI